MPPTQLTFTDSPSFTPTSPSGLFTPSLPDKCSDGRVKARKADPLRSYNDYLTLKNYFLYKDQIRNYALLTIGIATGLRISDLVALRYGHLYDTSGNFRRYIAINEKKTGKKTYGIDDNVLITEAVRQAVDALKEYTSKKEKRPLTLDDWLFSSKQCRKNKLIDVEDEEGEIVQVEDPLYGEYVITPIYGHRIMKTAQKDLNLPINMGSHTLRKTFMCLAYMIACNLPQHNTSALQYVQTMARHSDLKTTMRYLNITNASTEHIRNQISEFLLGRSDITDIDLKI